MIFLIFLILIVNNLAFAEFIDADKIKKDDIEFMYKDDCNIVGSEVWYNSDYCGLYIDNRQRIYNQKDGGKIYITNGYEKIKFISCDKKYKDDKNLFEIKINNNDIGYMTWPSGYDLLHEVEDVYVTTYNIEDYNIFCMLHENPVDAIAKAKQNEMEAQKESERISKLPSPRIGMTKKQAQKTNWGLPSKINYTITNDAKREQWVFGDGYYLYFTNGRLTAMQGND